MTKYPDIEVQLTGRDSNAFTIMGAVTQAMRKAGCDTVELNAFRAEAMSGDYDHLLRTCMEWITVL